MHLKNIKDGFFRLSISSLILLGLNQAQAFAMEEVPRGDILIAQSSLFDEASLNKTQKMIYSILTQVRNIESAHDADTRRNAIREVLNVINAEQARFGHFSPLRSGLNRYKIEFQLIKPADQGFNAKLSDFEIFLINQIKEQGFQG